MKTLYFNDDVMTFRHIYDAHWGCFVIRNDEKWIVFPQDFQPEVGKKYDVVIQWTQTGTFNYECKRYSVAIAHLKERANIIEEIDYKYRERKEPESPLMAAFKKVNIS